MMMIRGARPKLSDFAAAIYTDSGEDGVIDFIFKTIGTESKFCVEFGASDTLKGSNLTNLWLMQDWTALLIESDPQRFAGLEAAVKDETKCEILHRLVTPTGPDSIDAILADRPVDFMAIDIDGNDYWVWKEMQVRPRVICIEFNPTIPSHASLYQAYDTNPMGLGASLCALGELGAEKGYAFIGATACNAFFVRMDAFDHPNFLELDRDPKNLFPLDTFTFVATDFQGQAFGVGAPSPWGIRLPYMGPTIAGGTPYFYFASDARQTIDAFQARYGGNMALWPQENRPNISDPDAATEVPGGLGTISARNLLRAYLASGTGAICIAVEHADPKLITWIAGEASDHNYSYRLHGGVAVLTRSEQ